MGLEELKEQLKSLLEYKGLIYKHHRTLVCSSIWLDPINIVLLVLFICLQEKKLVEAGWIIFAYFENYLTIYDWLRCKLNVNGLVTGNTCMQWKITKENKKMQKKLFQWGVFKI